MLRLFVGPPGSGKTTLACKMAKFDRLKNPNVYCNFPNTVPGVGSATLQKLGQWTFRKGSKVHSDEAGIEYLNRNFKDFPSYAVAWYKKRRHYEVDMDLYSQYLDLDAVIMRLVDETWILYKIGPWTLARYASRRLKADKQTGELKFFYSFSSALWIPFWFLQLGWPFSKKWTLTFRPFYYKYFDSWECDPLPVRDFPVKVPFVSFRDRLRKAWHQICGSAVRLYIRFIEVFPWVKK